MTTAPYGTWKSPIGADLIMAKVSIYSPGVTVILLTSPPQSIGIAEIVVDPITGTLYHSESRPSEKGRNAIVRTEDDTDAFDLEWNARTGVHEYGGAAFCTHGGKVYFSDIKTGRIHRIDGQGPVPVSPGEYLLLTGSSTAISEDPKLIQNRKQKLALCRLCDTQVASRTAHCRPRGPHETLAV